MEGLIAGCRRYDPERINPATGKSYAISSIVCAYIEGALKHWIRDHGYDVKLPSKWREHCPRVRRLLAEGNTLEQVCALLPVFTPAEITEMLGGMVGTIGLEETLDMAGQQHEAELPVAAALYDLTAAAFENLRKADQGLLLRWWEEGYRRPWPSGPILQFHNRLKAQLRGRTLEQVRQGQLLTVEEAPQPSRERRPRVARTPVEPVVQPSLFASSRRRNVKARKL